MRSDTAWLQEGIRAVKAAKTTNFVELVKLAGLDVRIAFRYMNLSGADFSYCDLEGINFIGAKLKDAKFFKTKVAGAIFEFHQLCLVNIREADDYSEMLSAMSIDAPDDEIDRHQSINTTDENGLTALAKASAAGNIALVRCLLRFPKIDVNVLDSKRRTPLYLAVENRRAEIVSLLVEDARTDANPVFGTDESPIRRAVSDGSLAIATILLPVTANCGDPKVDGVNLAYSAVYGYNQRIIDAGNVFNPVVITELRKMVLLIALHRKVKLKCETFRIGKETLVLCVNAVSDNLAASIDVWKGSVSQDSVSEEVIAKTWAPVR